MWKTLLGIYFIASILIDMMYPGSTNFEYAFTAAVLCVVYMVYEELQPRKEENDD